MSERKGKTRAEQRDEGRKGWGQGKGIATHQYALSHLCPEVTLSQIPPSRSKRTPFSSVVRSTQFAFALP
jgi:hypothetical protein